MGESIRGIRLDTLPSEAEFMHHTDRGLAYLWRAFFRGFDHPVVLDEMVDKLQGKLVRPGINITHALIPGSRTDSIKEGEEKPDALKGGLVEIGFHTPVSDVLEGQPILLTLARGTAFIQHFIDPSERHLMLTARVNTFGTAGIDMAWPYGEVLHSWGQQNVDLAGTPDYKLPMAIAGVYEFMKATTEPN